jgi:hypothetical protein
MGLSDKVIEQFENEMKDFRDRLTVLETKVSNLEKIPPQLKELKEGIVEVIGAIASTLDIDSCIRDFIFVADRAPIQTVQELMGTYFKRIKDFVVKYDKLAWKELISQYMRRWASLIFMVTTVKRIEFDDFASIVIENLGSDLAKKYIALEDIVKVYGAENAARWKKLIE